jgi:hypothetical protein
MSSEQDYANFFRMPSPTTAKGGSDEMEPDFAMLESAIRNQGMNPFAGFGRPALDALPMGTPELQPNRAPRTTTAMQASVGARASEAAPPAISIEDLYSMFVNINQHIEYIEQSLGLIPGIQPEAQGHAQQQSPVTSMSCESDEYAYRRQPRGAPRTLDSLCMPLFVTSPSPTNSALAELAAMYVRGAAAEAPDRKTAMSVIRKWFRKHRDENGQKIFTACQAVVLPLLQQGTLLADIEYDVHTKGMLFQEIRKMAEVEITDPAAKDEFLREKIESFLERRVSKKGLLATSSVQGSSSYLGSSL